LIVLAEVETMASTGKYIEAVSSQPATSVDREGFPSNSAPLWLRNVVLEESILKLKPKAGGDLSDDRHTLLIKTLVNRFSTRRPLPLAGSSGNN
jgi:hypothetical protein